ncbi:rhamnan synthesis F family protein [Leptospira kanakyensis]|uniref:rhamnan synthesis F family protein n=1 Tax=Leptospira kanakyensis TaxID=2484968 RepID=UPI00223D1274|nr:rhamnan synthesis F family protein [Leptospira kanakyensis]MCW7471365.1 rhamnan synthesis F family protein [Leptospira kanakyensis]
MSKKTKIFINQTFHEKQNDRLVLFSTFNLKGQITKNLKFYLKSLSDLGSDIVLVDTSPISIADEIKSIQPYIKHYIWRENVGYDFGSWKTGLLETNRWEEYNQIVFTNDSIYGPLFSLKPIFDKFTNSSYDVWGLTDSYEFEHHIMSYFLVFQNRVLTSDSFKRFWTDLRHYPTRLKKFLILAYEIGGSKYWIQNGFKVGSLIEYQKLDQNIDSSYYINPTHVHWDTIVKNHGFPFIKRDLAKTLIAYGLTNDLENLLETNQYYPLDNIELISKSKRKL